MAKKSPAVTILKKGTKKSRIEEYGRVIKKRAQEAVASQQPSNSGAANQNRAKYSNNNLPGNFRLMKKSSLGWLA